MLRPDFRDGAGPWPLATVGELYEVKSGIALGPSRRPERNRRGYLRVANVRRGGIDLSDISEIEEMPQDEQRFAVRTGDLLVVEGHANPQEIGRCAMAGPEVDGLLHQNHLFRLCGNRTLPKLAELLINSPQARRHWLARSATSSGLYTINRKALSDLPLPIIPVDVQRRIVEFLEAASEVACAAEVKIAKLRTVRQGVLEAAMQSATADWHQRKLTDIVQLPTGQVDPREMPYLDQVLLAPDHVESRTGRVIGRESARAQGAMSGKYIVRPGDVVLSKIRPGLRKVVVADFVGTCSADMYPLRPTGEVLPEFLWAELLSETFSKFAESVSGRTGIPKLNRKDLSSYVMVLPPLADQRRIIEVLKGIMEEERVAEVSVAKLRTLKQGLADDLLSGRVRVGDVA
ncbi:restriction endonuclease subunit S [Streptomyces blastmyceticus]|uniref:Restriction endonuclease subunit S n=1 Tax=Streptomyces blastmyceticus TaxID=68180 RepID=A0ABN0WYJ4_9ACTN